MMYSSGFVIIIQDKTTISVTSWHQMGTRFVLDTQLVLETRFVLDTQLVLETRLVLEVLWYCIFQTFLSFYTAAAADATTTSYGGDAVSEGKVHK